MSGLTEEQAYDVMMSLFAEIWDSHDDEDMLAQLTTIGHGIEKRYEEYKCKRVIALCLSAHMEDDEDEKKLLEDEIEERGLTGFYVIFKENIQECRQFPRNSH